MILAAGKGTRLGEITKERPKALVDIGGTTPLEFTVRRLAAAGFRELMVNVHHFAEMVADAAAKIGAKEGVLIEISDESDELLDTGGGLWKVRDFFSDAPFLICNVDIIHNVNLDALYGYHIRKEALATLVVRHREGTRYLLTDDKGVLRGWINRKSGIRFMSVEEEEGCSLSEVAFSGIHAVSPDIFSHMQEGIYSITGLYLTLAAGGTIYTFMHRNGYWFDIGTPESLSKCRESTPWR